MGLTTVEEVLKLIELEDDEKGSKAYGLKSALNNTALARENIPSEINNQPTQQAATIAYEQPTEQATTIAYEQPAQQTTTIAYEQPAQQTTTIAYEQPTEQVSTIAYEQPTEQAVKQEVVQPQTLNDLINKAN